MSNQINNTGFNTAASIEQIFTDTLSQLENIKKTLLTEGLPEAKSSSSGINSDIPSLPSPSGGALSLESLISAIGFEQRRTNCKAGIESIEAKAQQQQLANEEQLQEIAKQLDKMDQQKVLNVFKKIFSIIGVIVGAVASAATIAAGAMTGNPLLMAAGAVGMLMCVDSIASMASDGKVSLMSGFAELGKAMGLSEKDAQIFALSMQMIITVAAVALSFGAGFANTASSAATTAQSVSKAANVINTTQKALNITNGVLTTAQGATTIANSVIQYQADQCKITQKELEAILERIRQAIEMEKDMVEAEMQRSNDLLGKVHDIVQDKNATQTAILAGTPNFA